MDKATLSHYGWIVIVTLVLSVFLSFTTPLGKYFGRAVVNTAKSIVNTGKAALDEEHVDKLQNEWQDQFNGSTEDEDWDMPEGPGPIEAITRPEETLPPETTEPDDPVFFMPDNDASDNVLTIQYLVKSDENLLGYRQSNGIVCNRTDGSIYEQKWNIGTRYDNGLVNATSFSLTKDNSSFKGWRVAYITDAVGNFISVSNSTVFDQNAPLTPEEITNEIKNRDVTVRMEAVWEDRITIIFAIDEGQISGTNGYSLQEDTNYLLKDEKVYEILVAPGETISLPDGESAFGLFYSIDYNFDCWMINPTTPLSTSISYDTLLSKNNGDKLVILYPRYEQTWY